MNESGSGLPPLAPGDMALLEGLVRSRGLPAQVRAVTATEPLTVVSAGAGTGKTWTLAWRFVWTALTRASVRRILTLTFTEKAAAEMRNRIADLLGEIKPLLLKSDELSRRRAQAASSLDEAYISTIHGFGARVIAEAGLSLPVEPSLRVLSDPEADEFWSELGGALDRLDAGWFARGMDAPCAAAASGLLADEAAAQAVSLWGADAVSRFARSFEGMMSDFGYTPRSVLDAASLPPDGSLARLREAIASDAGRLLSPWESALAVAPDGGDTGVFAGRFAALRAKWLGRDFSGPGARAAFTADASEAVKGARRGRLAAAVSSALGRKLSDWRAEALALLPFMELADGGFSPAELRLRSTLIRLAWLCWRKWETFKDARGALTFSDMISLARRALEAEPRYASRFSEVLVDEFQDTNEQQDGLLGAIRAASGARLFVVGDIKQSIYRFRRAEPALLEKYAAEARSGGGACVDLSVSFRSGERVLDAVNERFDRLWETSVGEGLDVPNVPLASPRGLQRADAWIDERQRTGVPACERVVEELRVDGETGKRERTESARDRLALRLACRLTRLRQDAATVWDSKARRLRPVAWGDMAVLTPTRGVYASLQRAFSLTAVPADFSGSRGFYARTEIRDVCALVRFVADPRDATAAAGFLCSPFSGLTQNEAQSLLPRLGVDPLAAIGGDFPDLARRLADLRYDALMRGPSTVPASLLAHGEFLENVHPRKRAGVLANLRRAVLLLEAYESGVGASPVGAAAYLSRALTGDVSGPDRETEAAVESGSDVVKVMTIHASKGLEFPLVAVFGLEHGSRAARPAVGPVPSRWLLAAASKFPEEWDEAAGCRLGMLHARLEERAEYEERQRLYYVALTRARDGLILCGLAPEGGGKDDRSLMSIELAGAPGFAQTAPPEAMSAERCREANAFAPRNRRRRGADVPAFFDRPRLLESVSATSYALWTMCPAAWRMRFRQNLDLSWNAASGESDTDPVSAGGAGLGSVAHWILSKWDFTPADARRILSLEDGCLRPEYRGVWRDGAARADLAAFLNSFETGGGAALSSRLRAALASGALRREYPFRVAAGAFDLVGAVDVFWLENDASGRPARVCVRDYKTTRLPGKGARREWMDDFYASQLKFYAYALRRAFPRLASLDLDLALWSLRDGEERRVAPFAPGEERRIGDALDLQARQAASGPWPANLGRCVGCAYAENCVFRPGA